MFKGIFNRKSALQIDKIKSNIAHLLTKYRLNDPTTPDLIIDATIPMVGTLKYAVKDLSTAPKNDNERRALNCFVAIGNCVQNVQKQLKSPLKNWASNQLLQVYPAAGPDLNAYYDRRSLKFFYYNHKGKNTYFCDSVDIITHELGHALLDAMRPDFWSVQALEIWSFHEAFSDITAMFNLMSYDVALQKMLAETNGNLLQSNCVSRLAEEVGSLIRSVTNDSSYLSNALRDPAVEKFYYVDPLKLPAETSNNKLASECHSFGRVFSNAWYNMMVKIFEAERAGGKKPLDALKFSRDFCFSVLVQSVPSSPRTTKYYEAVAKSMLIIAKAKNPKYASVMESVFKEWNIITSGQIKMLSDVTWKDTVRLLKKDDVVFKNSKSASVCVKSNKVFKLQELPMISSMSLDKSIEIEVPADKFYIFDSKGKLVDEIVEGEEELKNSVVSCLMNSADQIGENKMWKIENNKLVRNFVSFF